MVFPDPELADDADGLALADRDRHVVDRLDVADGALQEAAPDREPDPDRAGVDDDRRARGHRFGPALRLGGEQPLRVGMARALEHLGNRTLLDDLALRHDADPVGDLADDAEVVGDEQHRHAEARLHFGEELQDLRLDRDVERRRRLVGDEQVGLVRERHRDHDALALPARELVRIGVEAARCVAQADKVEHLERALARRPLRQPAVQPHDLADLPLDRVQRVERAHRLLEHHGDVVAPHPPHFVLGGAHQVAAFEENAARGVMRRRIRQELQDREGRH